MPLLPSFFFLSFYVTIPFNHRYFIAYLSMLKRCQSEVLSKSKRSSIEVKAKFYRIPIEVLSKTKRSSIEDKAKFYRSQSEVLSNTYRRSIEDKAKIYRIPIEYLSNIITRLLLSVDFPCRSLQSHQGNVFQNDFR